MSDQVTLNACADEIRTLLRDKRHDAAIALCEHVLRHYPKHIQTYRLMAEARLEKGDLDDARELFRRVLSADPEDRIAYVGLATIFEQEGLIDEAIWHLERAHELDPSDPKTRKNLERLCAERDGHIPERLKLTPGALARLYFREGLFGQAIHEYRAILADAPRRFDIRVALAETLWRTGKMRDAADVAQNLLNILPYCLKANLILGTVLEESALKEGDTCLQRAQALDPTNQVAQDLVGTQSSLRPAEPVLARYVEGAAPPESVVFTEASPEKRFEEWFAPEETKPAKEPAPESGRSIAPSEPALELLESPALLPSADAVIERQKAESLFEPLSAEQEAAELAQPTDLVGPPDETAGAVPAAPSVEPEPRRPAFQADLPPWLETGGAPVAGDREDRLTEPSLPPVSGSLPPWLNELRKTLEQGESEPAEPLAEPDSSQAAVAPPWLAASGKRDQETGSPTSAEQKDRLSEIAAPSWASLPLPARVDAPTPAPSEETLPEETFAPMLQDSGEPAPQEQPAPVVREPEGQVPPELFIEDIIELAVESSPRESGEPAEEDLVHEDVPAPQAEPPLSALQDVADESVAAPELPQEMPEWLRQLRAERTESEASAPEQAEEEAEKGLPGWLEEWNIPDADAEGERTSLEGAVAALVAEQPAGAPELPFQDLPAPIEVAPAAEENTTAEENIPTERAMEFPPPEQVQPEPLESTPIVAEMQPPEALSELPLPRRRREPKGHADLAVAREQRDANCLPDALKAYDYVVQHAPRLVNAVIDDLEVLIQQEGIPLEAHRILGDAYTRADRLAEALERYRYVLERVS